MDERRIEPLNFNGETIFVEITEVAPDDNHEAETGLETALSETGTRVYSTITALATTVHSALDMVNPTEWTLEINLGFKGKAGTPFITEGDANGAIKVIAKWVKK